MSNESTTSKEPTSVLGGAPKAPKAPKTPKEKSGKTSVGLIITFVTIMIAVVAVAAVLVIVLITRNTGSSGKKDDDTSKTTNKDDDKKDDKKDDDDKKKDDKKDDDDDDDKKSDTASSFKSLKVGYSNASFELSSSFADTVRDAAKNFDIYYLNEDYDYEQVEDVDSFLKKTDTGDDAYFTFYVAKKGTDADDNCIHISGMASYDLDTRTEVSLEKLKLWPVETDTDEDTTATIGDIKFTAGETTSSEARKALGKRDENSSGTKWDIFKKDDFSYTVYYNAAGGKVSKVEITVNTSER